MNFFLRIIFLVLGNKNEYSIVTKYEKFEYAPLN